MVTALTLACAFAAAAAAVLVVFSPDVMHGALALIAVLVALAGVYAGLGAHVIAAVQIAVYAGAIMILFLFAIMVLEGRREHPPRLASHRLHRLAAVLAGGAIFLGGLAVPRTAGSDPDLLQLGAPSIRDLAHLLFGEWLLPFELVGVLLFVALVAVMVLARPHLEDRVKGGAR